jgi:hypothetical protein
MPAYIAVIKNSSKELSSVEEGCTFGIYNNETGCWKLINEVSYNVSSLTSLNSIRNYIRSIVLKLTDCKIVMGKNISGLAYNIFNNMGFAIFETNVLSQSMMDEILIEVQAADKPDTLARDIPTSPEETETEGVYFLNLIDLQQVHPEISIDNPPFYRLELICSHIPPWLELVLPSKDLVCGKEEIGAGRLRVILDKKTCTGEACSVRGSL